MIRVPELERPASAASTVHAHRVRFADTDAMGIVYYAAYLRMFEAGRAEILRALDMPYRDVVDEGLFLPVVETWCRYRQPARYDELLQVHTWVHEVRSASALIGHHIVRDDTLLAEGAARIACMDGATGRARRLPERLRAHGAGEAG